MPTQDILVGRKVPGAMLAELVDGQVTPVSAIDLFGRGRAIMVGVPGAFTPVCTEQHVPSLVASADRLRGSGFEHIICVVTSDPFVVDAWSKVVDPQRKVRFVSDGNVELARALGLVTREDALFLGSRSQRYMLTLRSGTIESLRVEQKIADYACTRPDALFIEKTS